MDFRFGLRTLRRRPTFASLAVGLLGLGIGTFTGISSIIDGVLLRDLPYEGRGELVKIWQTWPSWQGLEGRDEFWDKVGLNWEEFVTLRDESSVLSAVAVFKTRVMTLTGRGTPERLDVGEASAGLFPMLGVRPFLGRTFLPGEEGPGTERLALLGYDTWKTRFGADSAVVGSSILLDGDPFEVIGVLAPRFRLRSALYNVFNQSMDAGDRALWVPALFRGTGLGAHDLEGLGRLAEGYTVPRLLTELRTVLGRGRGEDQLGFRVVRPREEIVGGYRSTLLLLIAAAGTLLLIACASIAVLLLSEAMSRGRELATRIALGAGRRRIFRQLLTESLTIGVLGAALGVALASAGTTLLGTLAPPIPRMEEVGLNSRVLLGAVLTGVVTSVLFGLAPVTLVHRSVSVKAGGAGGRWNTGSGGKLQKWVIGAELAFAVVLLANGGLLARSLMNLTRVDPGFETGGVAAVHVPLPTFGERNLQSVKRLYQDLLGSVRSLPGVAEAGAVDGLPFPGIPTGDDFEIVGADAYITPRDHIMLPGYLETIGIPLLAGRTLTDVDVDAEGVGAALINETMARLYWPDRSPLGARLRQGPLTLEIVGIVGDVREARLSAEPLPTVYRCRPVPPQTGMAMVVRASHDPGDLVAAMRRAIWAVDSDLPISYAGTLQDLVSASTAPERYRSNLVLLFAVLAALIASTGVFGVTAHIVSRRNREMGIRRALGATERRLVRGVVSEVMTPSALGIGVGLIGSLAASRLVERFVFGIGTWDGATFGTVAALLCGLAFVASALPAYRVTRIEPQLVLKED